MDYYDNDYTLGSCYWGPNEYKNYPVRTVVFNANINLDKMAEIKNEDYYINTEFKENEF